MVKRCIANRAGLDGLSVVFDTSNHCGYCKRIGLLARSFMKSSILILTLTFLTCLLLTPLNGLEAADTPQKAAAGSRIDRHALVTRHKISWDKLAGRLPLESHVTEAALGEF